MRRRAAASAALLLLAAPAAAQPERLGWEEPARACLEGDETAFVPLDPAPAPGGAMRLVIHRPDGSRLICDTAPDGRVIARLPAADPAAYAPRPDATAFFLDRRCVDARRIDGPGGRVLGWRAYPGC